MTDNRAQGIRIRLERCAKSFHDTRALEPLDLEIHPGETLVLLGPSGCGKTTTLRIIAGLEAPDPGGRVLFGDDDVTALPIEKRRVGMVFQSYALFPNMSVRENVEYGLRVRKVDAAERRRRVDAMLEMTEIGELAHRRIDQLSGGQRQRVALARAIAPQPRVLLLDEPLTALDARLRENLRTEINRLLRRLGVTTVYVTHDQAEAMALGDRIAVMDSGRLAQIGPPQAIYFEPADDFVASFIGTMNRVADHFVPGQWSAFRPEDVTLAAPGNGQAGPLGRVSASFFLGDHAKVLVDLPGADGAAPQVVTARVPPRLAPQVGETVHIVVAPDALRHMPRATP